MSNSSWDVEGCRQSSVYFLFWLHNSDMSCHKPDPWNSGLQIKISTFRKVFRDTNFLFFLLAKNEQRLRFTNNLVDFFQAYFVLQNFSKMQVFREKKRFRNQGVYLRCWMRNKPKRHWWEASLSLHRLVCRVQSQIPPSKHLHCRTGTESSCNKLQNLINFCFRRQN